MYSCNEFWALYFIYFNELVAPFFACWLEENENEVPMHSTHLFVEANLFQIMAIFSHV
jgi:hypothetical protein